MEGTTANYAWESVMLKSKSISGRTLKGLALSVVFVGALQTLPTSCLADATYLNWGFAFDTPNDGSYSDVQTYSMGRRFETDTTFEYFGEVGGWKDPGKYEGAKPALFVTGGATLNLNLTEHYIGYSLGPAFISRSDSLLGSNWQIYHKLSFGYRVGNKRIGLFMKHFSNAGVIGGRNVGRNFGGLEIGF